MTRLESVRGHKQTKLRAMQRLFYDNRIVEEGEVFLYEGDDLPDREVAVQAESTALLGLTDSMPVPPSQDAPPWTTKGFVDRANRRSGRLSAADDLLD